MPSRGIAGKVSEFDEDWRVATHAAFTPLGALTHAAALFFPRLHPVTSGFCYYANEQTVKLSEHFILRV